MQGLFLQIDHLNINSPLVPVVVVVIVFIPRDLAAVENIFARLGIVLAWTSQVLCDQCEKIIRVVNNLSQ